MIADNSQIFKMFIHFSLISFKLNKFIEHKTYETKILNNNSFTYTFRTRLPVTVFP